MWSQVLVNKCTLISDRHLIISEWEHLYKAEVLAVLVWTFRCGYLSKFTPRADRTSITEQVLFAWKRCCHVSKLHLNKPKTLMSMMHSIKSNTYHIKHGGGKVMIWENLGIMQSSNSSVYQSDLSDSLDEIWSRNRTMTITVPYSISMKCCSQTLRKPCINEWLQTLVNWNVINKSGPKSLHNNVRKQLL